MPGSGSSTPSPRSSRWSFLSSRSFALHAIPISYALAYPPHVYVLGTLMKASSSNYAFTNMVPRVNLERLGPSLPKATTDMLWRARGCHLNTLEGFPLFAAAMLAGTYTSLPTRDLNICAAEYLAARVVYNVLYMTVRSEAASYLRTAVYFYSVGIPFYVLWKAGQKAAGAIAQEKGKGE
ncbi:hypothetical protein PV08_02806 [Exophiala spinifera]|uniref:Uncharacterized protein n=1 Tax=Exophiala spinifera TaxID=91928 RepID=A0A0D2BHY0_9EURO|nr:uncharacterized protein PV08_02806 [Exophiala spinifera]KIW18518.1 hypothetical protein PV08_02806 [Exophiala spinifera]